VRQASAQRRRWIEQWHGAGPALAALRRRELAALGDEQALAATEALLSLAAGCAPDPRRIATSGLVAQQALLHRRR